MARHCSSIVARWALALTLLFREQCHQAAGLLGLVAPGEGSRFDILGKLSMHSEKSVGTTRTLASWLYLPYLTGGSVQCRSGLLQNLNGCRFNVHGLPPSRFDLTV